MKDIKEIRRRLARTKYEILESTSDEELLKLKEQEALIKTELRNARFENMFEKMGERLDEKHKRR